MRATPLLLSGVVALVLAGGSGAACSDDCPGIIDCGSPVEVSWSPDDLAAPALVRLCVDGACNEPIAPYRNPTTGDLHAPPWDDALPADPVDVDLQLLDENRVLVEALGTTAGATERCTCRTLRLTVDKGELITSG